MTDPPPPEVWSFFGLKLSTLIAGLIGSIIHVIKSTSKSMWGRLSGGLISFMAVIHGTPVISPIAAYYLGSLIPDQSALDGAVGFLLGVTGYSVITGLIKFAARWAENPTFPHSK